MIKKGLDIKLLNLKKLTPIADYFVITSGNSTTQVTAIVDEIEEKNGNCRLSSIRKRRI